MKKIVIFMVTLLGITISSCTGFLDINTNPNSPSSENVTSDMMFSGAEMNLAASYGNLLRIYGGYFAQQYAHSFGTSNYVDFSQFTMSATRSSSTYTQLFTRALNNFNIIRDNAQKKEQWGTFLAATVMRVFTYQVLIDAYGEMPYTEAFNLSILSPKYDEGNFVYKGILSELDEALSKVSPADLVCSNFLFKSGKAEEWIQFANALKLKILMRMSKAEEVKKELSSLISENNFPESDVVWSGFWADESGKANPYYQEEFATYFGSTQINVVLNLAYLVTMAESEDGRLMKFFNKNGNGEYKGGVSGTNFSTSKQYQATFFCRPNATFDMPVYLISRFETEFFLAEYYARYGSSSDAERRYKAAIEASFASAGAEGADVIYNTHYKWDKNNFEKIIGIQKWVALGGTNNFEAWCELRRLKYPAFGTVTGSDIYNVTNDTYSPEKYEAGTLYTPIKYNTELGAGKVLQRFRYAESSTSRNANVPANKGDATPVFWAK